MKEENLSRAKELVRELDESRTALKFAILESTVGVSLWYNGKGSVTINNLKLKKTTQDVIRAILRIDIEERLSGLEKEMEGL